MVGKFQEELSALIEKHNRGFLHKLLLLLLLFVRFFVA